MNRLKMGAANPVAIIWLTAILWVSPGSGVARGQTPAPPVQPAEENRFDLGLGVLWVGGSDLGATAASLTTSSGGSPFILFRAQNDLAHAAGFQARLGYRVFDAVSAEGAFSYRRPELRSTVTNDFEATGVEAEASEQLSEYVFELNAVLAVRRWAFGGGRTQPFVQGGVGYLRFRHEGGGALESGWLFQGGGGLKFDLTTGPIGWFDAIGLRTDAGIVVRSGGVGANDQTAAVTLGVSLVGSF